jgi:steroid 5-alpha reductase family enzyme
VSHSRALAAITVAYVVAIGAAIAGTWGIAQFLPLTPLYAAAVADVLATCVIFGFSFRYNNTSVYDAYWSVIPPFIAAYWIFESAPEVGAWRAWIAFALVAIWGVRLTYNWAIGWAGMEHEDWRYVRQRDLTGKFYWLVSFAALQMFPTVLVFAGCLPLWIITQHGAAFNAFDVAGIIITSGAIAIESIADEQLRAFRRSNPPKGTIMNRGLWSWSRHPNYFGELMFWWGLLCFGFAASPSILWQASGALGMTLLFLFISIPMIDKRHHERRPAYAEHAKRVSRLVPLPPRQS